MLTDLTYMTYLPNLTIDEKLVWAHWAIVSCIFFVIVLQYRFILQTIATYIPWQHNKNTSRPLQYRFHDRIFQEAYYCNMHTTMYCPIPFETQLNYGKNFLLFVRPTSMPSLWASENLHSSNKNIHHCEIPISIRFLLLCPENTQHKDVNTITIEIP